MRMGTVAADQMGMLGTLQNCLYMRDTLAHLGAKATVMTAVDMPRFAEPYNTVKALELLSQGHIVLFACGIGSPCFSTDTTVVLRGIELECDAILMDQGHVTAIPELTANHIDASLIHEAAIGKIAGEQLIKLMTLGLTEEEAEAQIVGGFLK
jgi:hypothetical protein